MRIVVGVDFVLVVAIQGTVLIVLGCGFAQ